MKFPGKPLLPAAALSLSLLAPTVFAQQAAPARSSEASNEGAIQLDAFVVTGSNIRRVDAETALPVSVFEPIDISARGAATMAELFDTLGAAEISAITEINNGPQLARGDVASVDLRGIGSGSTLTLVNGRRMAPHPISMAENGVPSLAVNINAVPRALIGRVEILRDGASAIYGADAAAGVINNIVSRTYTGRQVSLRGSMTQHGGANEIGATYAEGFKFGKTHFSISIDYFHRDALAANDRKWASNSDQLKTRDLPAPWNGLPLTLPDGSVVRENDFDNSNNVNQWGQWQRGFIQSDYLTFVGSRPEGNRGIVTSGTIPTGVATMATDGTFYLWPSPDGIAFKSSRPSKNIDNVEDATYSNWNQWKFLIPRTSRYQVGMFLDRNINDRVSLFGDLLFYAAHSVNRREPVNFKNTDDQGIYVSRYNPYNPFGVRFYDPAGLPNSDGTPRLVGTPADVSVWTGVSPGQNTGGGFHSRMTEVFSYSFRALAGLRGRLGDVWEWESAVLASGAQTHEYEHYQVRESRLRQALDSRDSTALNPFPVTFKVVNNQIVVDKPFTNPDSVLDPLYDDEDRFGRTNLFLWDARVTGRPWRLFKGGDIGVAAGTEVRYETFQDKRADYVGFNPPGSGAYFPYLREGDNDFLALSPNAAIAARQTIFATYAEVALPFVTRANRIPLIETLEITGAARYEHFSIFGQTTKPKASLVWHPVRWIKLRASIAESFRSPNLPQTNVAALKRQSSFSDSYRSTVTGLISDGSQQRTSYRQGNQNLKPEEAQTTSGGIVIEVPKVRGLSFTFDYFKINQNSVIENRGASATASYDSLMLQLATQAALAAGTPIDKIDLGSGTENYQGYRFVNREKVTDADRAAFAAYNAKQPTTATMRAPVGELISVIDSYVNLSGRDLQGYEMGFQYRMPKTNLGQFTLSGEATHYVLRRSQAEPGARILDELDRNGRVSWRANSSLTWKRNQLSAGWFVNYFGGFVDTSAETTANVYNALGAPGYVKVFNDNGAIRYLLRVPAVYTHNAWASYQFSRSAPLYLKGVTLRVGVNNVFDKEPPIADESLGYGGTSLTTRGRQFTFQMTKTF